MLPCQAEHDLGSNIELRLLTQFQMTEIGREQDHASRSKSFPYAIG